jgi:hypothetical protein
VSSGPFRLRWLRSHWQTTTSKPSVTRNSTNSDLPRLRDTTHFFRTTCITSTVPSSSNTVHRKYALRTPLILLVAALKTVADELPHIFDYTQLPSCAGVCKNLSISELNCVPPSAPVANGATSLSWICQTDLLMSLHISGTICEPFCSDADAYSIYASYNILCGTPYTTLAATSTEVASATTSSTADVPSATAPAHSDDHHDQQGAPRPWYVS